MDDDEFPFGFGGASGDEGSEGLFCAPKVKKTAPTKGSRSLVTDQELYFAQIDEDGWFHETKKSIQELMLHDKTGATKVKMQADHHYMLHRYQEAYDIAREYCTIVAANEIYLSQENSGIKRPEPSASESGSAVAESTSAQIGGVLKVTDSREMQEMALRCALKLGKITEAEELADGLTSSETGIVFLKAKVYTVTSRFHDAAEILVRYQKTRSSNYAVWRQLGECINEVSSATLGAGSTTLLPVESLSLKDSTKRNHAQLALALICILRAIHLMRASSWPEADYAKRRYEGEMCELTGLWNLLEQKCGIVHVVHEDMADEDWAERLEEYETKIIKLVRTALEDFARDEQAAITDAGVSAEVVEFIVGAWDPQLVGPPPKAAEDEDDGGERVRDK